MSDGTSKSNGGTLSEIERVGTGHAEADEVLHGGFPANSINIIMGAPGTGKTVLAEQILFHNAGGERPVVYLSTLSEPLSKMVTYLQRFDFYDEEAMLGSVVYEDVGPKILEEGVDYLVERVEELIRERRPKILVIDSFKALHDLTSSREDLRRLSARLGGLLSAYEVTTFLIGEYVSEEVAMYPEFAVADGVVQLERRETKKWDDRYLRVLKLRGSSYAEGVHSFTITAGGLQVYPRFADTPPSPSHPPLVDRLRTGVEGLDPVVGGGLHRGSTTLILGTAGTGKTTMGLSFVLEGVRSGQPSLFLNLQENPVQLAQAVKRFGVDLEEYRERGLHLRYFAPVELRIDSVVVEILAVIREHGVRRVVVDGLADIRLAAADDERFHDYLYALVQHFKIHDVTALLTMEARHEPRPGVEVSRPFRLSALSDGLITLDLDVSGDAPQRFLRVVKARSSVHALGARPFEITDRGIRVLNGGAADEE